MNAEHLLSRLDAVKRTGVDRWQARCPAHKDRTPSLFIRESEDKILVRCFAGCEPPDIVGAIGLELRDLFLDVRTERVGMPTNMIPRSQVARAISTAHPHLTLAAHWRDLWRSLEPVKEGTTAAKYLAARECEMPPHGAHLRCTESLRHPSGYVGPAMIGLVTDAVTRQPLTLHRTWILASGDKADVDPPRMLLGKHRKQGGVIRLSPDDGVTTGLGIVEGIETGLTLLEAYSPVWSCIDAGNLATFPILEGIESLLIGADNDPAGLKAADECARAWYHAGREVRICKSPIPGQDLNDFARAAA